MRFLAYTAVIFAIAVCSLRAQPPSSPPSYDQLIQQSRDLVSKKQLNEAGKLSETAISRDPNRWEAYALLGSILALQQRYEQSISFFQRAIDHAPQDRKPALQKALNEATSASFSSTSLDAIPSASVSQAAALKTEKGVGVSVVNLAKLSGVDHAKIKVLANLYSQQTGEILLDISSDASHVFFASNRIDVTEQMSELLKDAGQPAAGPGTKASITSRVAVIDMQKAILENSDGRQAVIELEKRFSPVRTRLNEEADALAKIDSSLRNTTTGPDRLIIQKRRDDAANALEQHRKESSAELETFQNKILQEIGSKMISAINSIATKNELTIVIDISSQPSIVAWSASLNDITGPLVTEYEARKIGVLRPIQLNEFSQPTKVGTLNLRTLLGISGGDTQIIPVAQRERASAAIGQFAKQNGYGVIFDVSQSDAVLSATDRLTGEVQGMTRLLDSSPTQAEVVLWKSIENSKNPEDFKAYLKAYPNGAFAPLARSRLGQN